MWNLSVKFTQFSRVVTNRRYRNNPETTSLLNRFFLDQSDTIQKKQCASHSDIILQFDDSSDSTRVKSRRVKGEEKEERKDKREEEREEEKKTEEEKKK